VRDNRIVPHSREILCECPDPLLGGLVEGRSIDPALPFDPLTDLLESA
jgi:hypothetical protein